MPPEEVINAVKSWFQKAESDLKTIKILLEVDDNECPFEIVCFHAQQAAEKYLKGYLTFFGIPFSKTHYLPELLSLLPDGLEIHENVGDLSELSYFAVQPRYPGDLDEYNREKVQSFVTTARTVKKVILEDLEMRGIKEFKGDQNPR